MHTLNGSDLILAPLAGYSDAGMRMLCFSFGAGLCFTEMTSAKGIVRGNRNTDSLIKVLDGEKNTGIQLFGSDPDSLARAVRDPRLAHFPVIDLNAGCPVRKVVRNGDGCALMRDPALVYALVSAIKKNAGTRKTTIKLRKGIDGATQATECAIAAEEAGADMITIHCRTREQMFSGPVDYDIAAEVKRAVRVPVCANGDVVDRASYLRMKETGADYVMIGRGAIGRPYVFDEILSGRSGPRDVCGLMRRHIEYLGFLPERAAHSAMKCHIAAYLRALPCGKAFRAKIFGSKNLGELRAAIDEISVALRDF